MLSFQCYQDPYGPVQSFGLRVLMRTSPGSPVEKSLSWRAIGYYGFAQTETNSASPPRFCYKTEASWCKSRPSPQRPQERGSTTTQHNNTATVAWTVRNTTRFEKTAGLVAFDPNKHG